MQPLEISGTPAGIRTQDLRIRSPLLYPAELQAHNTAVSKPYKVEANNPFENFCQAKCCPQAQN
jgi:hypothetical protein